MEGTCSAADCASTIGGSTFISSCMTVGIYILALPTFIWLVCYLTPQLYMALRPVPDLKKKYNASWSLVTGAGSGIGKAELSTDESYNDGKEKIKK